MTDIEISILTLLAKGAFVLISALCIAETLKGAMAGKGWRSAYPLLTWLAWVLVTCGWVGFCYSCWQMRTRMFQGKFW